MPPSSQKLCTQRKKHEDTEMNFTDELLNFNFSKYTHINQKIIFQTFYFPPGVLGFWGFGVMSIMKTKKSLAT